MSSFRIDRQYVSFETAETEPVHVQPVPPPPDPKPTAPKTPAPQAERAPKELDVSKIYEEIYQRLQSEHAEQVQNMLSKAADEAKEIVGQAKKQAEELLAQAGAESDRLRENIRNALETEAARRKAEDEKALTLLQEKLNNDYGALVDEMHSEIVSIVMEIARKVIGIKLSESDDIFLNLVRDALDQLKQTGSVVIRVSPEDYQRYFGEGRGETAIDAGDTKLGIVEEADFKPGDLIVESEGEMIDLSINRQLDQIEKAFLK